MNENCSEEVQYNLDSVVRKLAKEVTELCEALGVDSRHDVPEKEALMWHEKLSALIQSINASANDIAGIREMIEELDELIRGPESKRE